jgi:hypothetical protein
MHHSILSYQLYKLKFLVKLFTDYSTVLVLWRCLRKWVSSLRLLYILWILKKLIPLNMILGVLVKGLIIDSLPNHHILSLKTIVFWKIGWWWSKVLMNCEYFLSKNLFFRSPCKAISWFVMPMVYFVWQFLKLIILCLSYIQTKLTAPPFRETYCPKLVLHQLVCLSKVPVIFLSNYMIYCLKENKCS